MRTQYDGKARVVALSNLRAMCDRVSGVCHRYHVVKVTANRVYVEYSNPNEYGTEYPITAVYPSFPSDDGCFVVLDWMLRCTGAVDGDGSEEQAFDCLVTSETLWRSNPDKNDWRTQQEIENAPHA